MTHTDHYCPGCSIPGARAFLNTNGTLFRCPDCKTIYNKDKLIAAYRNDLEVLETDALYVRGNMESLEATA